MRTDRFQGIRSKVGASISEEPDVDEAEAGEAEVEKSKVVNEDKESVETTKKPANGKRTGRRKRSLPAADDLPDKPVVRRKKQRKW